MERLKVTANNEIEFVTEIADECLKNMKEKDKNYLIDNPYAIDYHFSYCLDIRNHYIHNRDFTDVDFWAEPDHLSSEIIRMIFSELLPEYDYNDPFTECLYDSKKYIKLRREYKNLYGEYPVFIVEKYKTQVEVEPIYSISEIGNDADEDIDLQIKEVKKNHEKISEVIEHLIKELAELVWQTEALKKTAEEYGINYSDISAKIDSIKDIFFSEGEYIPLQVCFLPYREKIGNERYIEYRRLLSKELKEHPRLIEKLDVTYFNDKVLARSVLKYSWGLKYLPMYQDDEKMVRLSLEHDGETIQYANKRFQQDRKWVKFAIEHSENGTIMYLDCMKPYRKDKELVYLACEVERWNFLYVDKVFRDDDELAILCMKQIDNPNSIYNYLSKRLKSRKEIVMLDLQEEYPHVEEYPEKLRNDDEVAAKLYELHGAKSWAWHYMSKRLQKKYGVEEG